MRAQRPLAQWRASCLVAGLCFVDLASAQADCGTRSATATIRAQSDAASLTACTVYTGSLSLATSVSGAINLPGIEEIRENLLVSSTSSLVSLSSDSLRRIGGNFTISNTTLLSNLSFPALTAVGTISLLSVPAVSAFDFTAGLDDVENVFISDTFLQTLDGINLKNSDNVQIDNNRRLTSINLPIEGAKNSIGISANGRNLYVNLPKLTSAGSIVLRNLSGIWMPALSYLSGSLQLEASNATNLTMGALAVVAQDLVVRDNARLANTSFPELLSARAVNVENNSVLPSLTFEKLSRATDISVRGNLSSMEMPGLTDVQGVFDLQSVDKGFNCSVFDAQKEAGVLQGTYVCLGTHEKVTTATNTSSSSTSTNLGSTSNTSNPIPKSSDSGLSGGAKAGIAVGCMALAIGVALGVWLLLRRRNKRRKEAAAGTGTVGTDGKAELENEDVPRKEMATGQEAHELPGEHGTTELAGVEETHELPGESVPPRRQDNLAGG